MERANTAVGSGSPLLAAPLPRPRSRRALFLSWVRKIHLYVGLWGAILGLLFGVTGILLNHRAILKIPVEKSIQKTVQLALPAQRPATPEELSAWLQGELKFTAEQVVQVKTQAAKAVIWGDQELTQPERWSVSLQAPQRGVSAEYFIGNRFVKLDHTDATPIGTLTRLHMSIGVNAFWVLLADSIAGSLILLSITGLLLWTQLRAMHTTAVCTSIGALIGAIWFMWSI